MNLGYNKNLLSQVFETKEERDIHRNSVHKKSKPTPVQPETTLEAPRSQPAKPNSVTHGGGPLGCLCNRLKRNWDQFDGKKNVVK